MARARPRAPERPIRMRASGPEDQGDRDRRDDARDQGGHRDAVGRPARRGLVRLAYAGAGPRLAAVRCSGTIGFRAPLTCEAGSCGPALGGPGRRWRGLGSAGLGSVTLRSARQSPAGLAPASLGSARLSPATLGPVPVPSEGRLRPRRMNPSALPGESPCLPAKRAGLRIGCAQELPKFSHVIAGHPVVTLPQQNYAHSSLFVTNVIRGPCRAGGPGRGLGLLPGAGTLAGRTDRCSRARLVLGAVIGEDRAAQRVLDADAGAVRRRIRRPAWPRITSWPRWGSGPSIRPWPTGWTPRPCGGRSARSSMSRSACAERPRDPECRRHLSPDAGDIVHVTPHATFVISSSRDVSSRPGRGDFLRGCGVLASRSNSCSPKVVAWGWPFRPPFRGPATLRRGNWTAVRGIVGGGT